MIGELEQNHGVLLARLVRGAEAPVEIATHSRSAYVVGGRCGLYVKYSTSRLSPWSFSFSAVHQREIQNLSDEFQFAFVALVCGKDGIACLNARELNRVLDDDHRETEWVKASRRPREKYLITGTDDRRGFKVADSEFPAKLITALATDSYIASDPELIS